MLKSFIITIAIGISLLVLVKTPDKQPARIKEESSINIEKLANAIYLAEGGDKTNFPYGIKSIETKGNKEYAHKICLNSIRNNIKRWHKAGEPEEFIDFMARRYCPISDSSMNYSWPKNVKYFYNRK